MMVMAYLGHIQDKANADKEKKRKLETASSSLEESNFSTSRLIAFHQESTNSLRLAAAC
jgi:hypothetical protein